MRAPLVSLTLPEPPSANRYWRVYRGRPVKSVEAESYAVAVLAAFRAQTTSAERARYPLSCPVGLALTWFRGRKSGDLDNRIKQVCDAMQGLLYVNDSQIECLIVTRKESPGNARLEVELFEPAEILTPRVQ